jgi:hypothetical protein
VSWKSIFWYVFAVRGGYGNAAALADAYHLAMGALRRIAVVSGFLMIACVVARWEDGPNHLLVAGFRWECGDCYDGTEMIRERRAIRCTMQ